MDDKNSLKATKDRVDELRRTVMGSKHIPIKRSELIWLMSQFDNLYLLHDSDHDLAHRWLIQRDKAERRVEELLNLLQSLDFFIQHPNGEYKDSELFRMVNETIKKGREKRATR